MADTKNDENNKLLKESATKEAKANIHIIHDNANLIERRDINSINSISAREAILMKIKQSSIQNSTPISPTNKSNSNTKKDK
jgi:hypothetical protein